MSVMWFPGAALRVLGPNANMPVVGLYAKKCLFSSKWDPSISKEFQKQRRFKAVDLSATGQRIFGWNSDNDDERIVTVPTEEDNSDFSIAGETTATICNRRDAPLEETDFRVLIELLGAGSGKDRAGVDIVTVLDVGPVSLSWDNTAREGSIAKVKLAMQFLLKKLSPIDRLSVVLSNFYFFPKRLCPLRQITKKSQSEIIDMINWKFFTFFGSDILAGLERGRKVLKDRRYADGRESAIMLISSISGKIKINKIPYYDVPVHTFGVGQGYNEEVLCGIAKKSKGGTFSDVQQDNLSIAFSQCLAGLLSIVVNDLTLTLTRGVNQNASHVTIVKVCAGNYSQKEAEESVTVSFGNIYDKELRRVFVYLRLPAVLDLPEGTEQVGANVLEISYTYRATGGPVFESAPLKLNIIRKKTVEPERDEVKIEDCRLQTVGKMLEARLMADENKLEGAKNKLLEAQKLLQVEVFNNALIKELLTELHMLMKLMQSKDIYDKQGRPYALSLEASHDRQRSAARGNEVKIGGLYSTPRMDIYVEQAKAFVKDSSKPVPTVDDDVKKETRADPIAPIPGTVRLIARRIS